MLKSFPHEIGILNRKTK